LTRTTVRLSEETRAILRELARESEESMQTVLARAVEAYRRQRVLESTNEAYAALRADPDAWRTVQEERAAWDAALADKLDEA
jgi:predicted transcriptional regulator